MIVDIAVDQGGCVETIRPTTLLDPIYLVDGVVHYGVANMPALVPRTSTFALTNATLPYVARAGRARRGRGGPREPRARQGRERLGRRRSCTPGSPSRSARPRRPWRRCSAEDPRRDVGVQLPGVARHLLPRQAPGRRRCSRTTSSASRPSRSTRRSIGCRTPRRSPAGGRRSRRVHVRPQGAAADHALRPAPRRRRAARGTSATRPARSATDWARCSSSSRRTSRRRPIGWARCSRWCRTNSAWPSSSATRAGSTTRCTPCSARATPRSASPTPRRARPRRSPPPTSATSGCAPWSTPTTSYGAGSRRSTRSAPAGATPTSSSSTKTRARAGARPAISRATRGIAGRFVCEPSNRR